MYKIYSFTINMRFYYSVYFDILIILLLCFNFKIIHQNIVTLFNGLASYAETPWLNLEGRGRYKPIKAALDSASHLQRAVFHIMDFQMDLQSQNFLLSVFEEKISSCLQAWMWIFIS